MLGSNFVKFLMPILKRQVTSAPIFVSFFSFIKDYFSVIFLAQTIYILLKKSQIKWKFLRFWSAWVKFCQIPYANFETTSRFLSNFCMFLQFHKRLFLCTFLSSNNIYFAQKEPIPMKIFEILESRVIFYQIPDGNSETTIRFLSNFCIFLHFHKKLFLCNFF